MRVAIISSKEKPNWVSCQSIGDNLRAAYKSLPFTIADFRLSGDATIEDYQATLGAIRKFGADQISIIDHVPQPQEFLRTLARYWPTGERPIINIHIYGDFVLFGRRWLEIERPLKSLQIRWICASPRHLQLISRLLHSDASLHHCPFPINNELFYFDAEARSSLRSQHGVADDEIVFTYTGRLSVQKNIELLINGYLDFAARQKRASRLWLIGRTDTVGAAYFGIHNNIGDYDQRLIKLLESRKDLRSRITFIDQCSQQELARHYNAADVFVSLSTHHDEDYGMSPLEAVSTGCRAILSRWGGFDGFSLKGNHIDYIPIKIDKFGLFMNSLDLKRSLARTPRRRFSDENRLRRANMYAHKFCISQVGQRYLSKILRRKVIKFAGFSDQMKRVIPDSNLKWPKVPTFFVQPNKDSTYHSLYGAYFE